MDTWAEGNTNKALENLLLHLDEKKLNMIIKICKEYLRMYSQDIEIVGNLENDIIGFFFSFYVNLNKEGQKKWKAFADEVNDKIPYLKGSASLESIVLALLKRNITDLELFLKYNIIACHNTTAREAAKVQGISDPCEFTIMEKKYFKGSKTGGASRYSYVEDFVTISTKNTSIIQDILRHFYNDEKKSEYFDIGSTGILYELCTRVAHFWNLKNTDIFIYSDRVSQNILDVWKTLMFLYHKPARELKKFLLTNVTIKKFQLAQDFSNLEKWNKKTVNT